MRIPIRKNKYNNVKTVIDGITFASKKEAKYYAELKIRKQAGLIKDFEVQPSYLLQPSYKNPDGKTIRAIHYVADFKVVHNDGTIDVIDVKGAILTEVFKIKRKMLEFQNPGMAIKIV